ncbi:MAG: OmpA family protein [Campylobacterota bacterium]|nr:OmpA family protein [Campylobacterota bacterium]
MKKIILFSAISLLLLSGCSQKKPKPAATDNIAGDTVTINENSSSGSSSNAGSSSDGMRSIYFDFGKYGLSPSMQDTVSFDADILKQKLKGSRVKIEGNCDEFGSDEYNFALGLKRAKSVKDSLSTQGISSSQIVLVSYGESNPQCRNMSDSCYQKNRRVDLKIVK